MVCIERRISELSADNPSFSGSNLKGPVHTKFFFSFCGFNLSCNHLAQSIVDLVCVCASMNRPYLITYKVQRFSACTSLRFINSEAWRSNDNSPHGRSAIRFNSVLHLLCIFLCSDIVMAFLCLPPGDTTPVRDIQLIPSIWHKRPDNFQNRNSYNQNITMP